MVSIIGIPPENNNRRNLLGRAKKEFPDLHLYAHGWRDEVYLPLAERLNEVHAMVMPVVGEIMNSSDPYVRADYSPDVQELRAAFDCRDPQKYTKALYAFLQTLELEDIEL